MHNGAISQNPEALLAKIDELVAQNQALQRENRRQKTDLEWAESLRLLQENQVEALQRELNQAYTANEQAKQLLLQWDRTNEAQLAELTRLYGIEQQALPALQSQVAALEQEVKSLRDWNAATVSPVRCECKTCDSRASHQHQ